MFWPAQHTLGMLNHSLDQGGIGEEVVSVFIEAGQPGSVEIAGMGKQSGTMGPNKGLGPGIFIGRYDGQTDHEVCENP